MSLNEKALKIKAIVLDIDGVMTDGAVGYSETENEIKFFNVKDGLGIKFARESGLLVGVITGRSSTANTIRARELKLDFIYQGSLKKIDALEFLLKEYSLKAEECLYIGDDIIDIPPAKKAGIAVAVADAADDFAKVSDFQTKAAGGKGAVRETIEWLLKEQNKWENILKKY
ncbi:MAG: HAD-IIIA family hydrolase [Victivallales bacterium]|nr:HAD-IIIA family hydrolase [Victivallales bacterium]